MKIDPSVSVQKQVRENAQDVENFMLDLKSWEEGIKKKERNVLSGGKASSPANEVTVTREDVDYVKTVFNDGVRQMKNGNWELAVSSFSKAIRKYKKNPMFFLKRAKCYLHLKKAKEAESDCSAALALDPKILKAKFYRSRARVITGHLRGACLDLQDILILDPANTTAQEALEKIKPLYLSSIGIEKPVIFEEEAPSKDMDMLAVLSGNDDSAVLEAELEEKIIRANAEKERGNKLVKAEKWSEAMEAYSKAIMIYPDDAIFYANRALCHIKTKNEKRAVIDCSMALKKNPRYGKAYLRRSVSRKATGDLWGARSDVKQLLLLEPNNTQAKADLEELNLLLECKLYSDFKNGDQDSSSSGEDDYESAEEYEGYKEAEEQLIPKESLVKTDCEEKKAFRYVLPIDKPPHLRSKKPLKRVPIRFTDTEATVERRSEVPPKKPSRKPIEPMSEEPAPRHTEEPAPRLTEELVLSDPLPQVPQNTPVTKENVHKEKLVPKEISGADFRYVFPINKKPHQCSKKPLMRIPIKFLN